MKAVSVNLPSNYPHTGVAPVCPFGLFAKKISLGVVLCLPLLSTGCNRTESPQTINATASTNQPTTQANPTASQVASTTDRTSLAHQSDPVPANHLTLYTSIDKRTLQPLLADFERQKAVSVNVVNDEPMSILARLKAESDNSPADIILTDDVGVFHQATEAELLQAFSADSAVASIPERYRDPDGNWLALSSYARTAVYDSRVMTASDISSYGDFAKPKWFQKLCLSQASFIPNQSLVVNLIHNLGDKKAQETLTGWVSNLAMPVVVDDNAVMQAIDSGKCQVGLVSSHTYANYVQKNPQTPIKLAWANKGYGGVSTNVMAAAIPKTAKNPQLALSLIEWLSTKEHQTLLASLSNTYPINKDAQASVLLKSWEEFEPSPIAVSEYGEKQKVALDVMQDAGWQ